MRPPSHRMYEQIIRTRPDIVVAVIVLRLVVVVIVIEGEVVIVAVLLPLWYYYCLSINNCACPVGNSVRPTSSS